MLLVTTALMLEARPVCAGLGLHSLGNEPFPAFAGERCVLIVTGTGPLRASAATGWALARFPGIRAAVNIGLAGAAPSVSPLYRWHLIHSIRDQSTGRLHLPDILWRHPFPEAALLTVGRVAGEDTGWNGLVDMEGSGFYEAARQFLPPDRIALLKWVSDPLSGAIEADAVAARLEADLAGAIGFINDWPAGRDDGDAGEPPLLETIRGRLRLTETQDHFLRKWVAGYLARGGDPDAIMRLLPEAAPVSKAENRRHLEALKHVFKR